MNWPRHHSFEFAEKSNAPPENSSCQSAGTPDNDAQMNALLRPTSNAKAQQQAVTCNMILHRTEAEAPILATVTGTFYRGNLRDVDDPDEITDIEARDESGALVELTEAEEEEAAAKLLEVAR